MFHLPSCYQVLITKSIDYLKDWILIIRQGRQLHKDLKYIMDKFSTSTALQQWIGLQQEQDK